MLTIKYKRNGAALLSEAIEVLLARPGSPQYAEALKIAGELGVLVPDVIQTFPQADQPQGGVLQFLRAKPVRSFVKVSERVDQSGRPMAVARSEAFDSDHPEVTGTAYQFVYPGDELFVMNRFGQTVDLVKQKSYHKAP